MKLKLFKQKLIYGNKNHFPNSKIGNKSIKKKLIAYLNLKII